MSRAISHIDTFQGLILALQNYWAEQGCVVLQPYDMEMGAGTFHTATFLRALGLKHGTPRMFNLRVVRKMDAMVRTQTAYNIIINFKWYLSQTQTISNSFT
jgi:hypothetical protein